MTDVFTWYEMKFWGSGEWQKIQEDLDDRDAKKVLYCPGYDKLFAALDAVTYNETKVMVVGQDPYPNIEHATGIAFDVPKTVQSVPATLGNIFSEYCADLHYPYPQNGSLLPWVRQGVLLWNAIPTCLVGSPGSDHGWTEWGWLTKELVEVLDAKGIVFVFLGSVARDYYKYTQGYLSTLKLKEPKDTTPIDYSTKEVVVPKLKELLKPKSRYIELTHPSPRGQLRMGGNRFLGSRVFTKVNDYLNELKLGSIDWRLE